MKTAISWNQGPAGSGASGYEVVTATSSIIGPEPIAIGTATCPAGKKPVGGGISFR